DFDANVDSLKLLISLIRMGVGDRFSLACRAPTPMEREKFYLTTSIRETPTVPFELAVRRLVTLAQRALILLGLTRADDVAPSDRATVGGFQPGATSYLRDGFACDRTLEGMRLFFQEFGPFERVQISDGEWVSPSLVEALLQTMWTFRSQLLDLGFSPPKDISGWEIEAIEKMIKHFQKREGLPVTKVLDLKTRERMRYLIENPVTGVSTTVQALKSRWEDLLPSQSQRRDLIMLAEGTTSVGGATRQSAHSKQRRRGVAIAHEEHGLDFFMQVANLIASSPAAASQSRASRRSRRQRTQNTDTASTLHSTNSPLLNAASATTSSTPASTVGRVSAKALGITSSRSPIRQQRSPANNTTINLKDAASASTITPAASLSASQLPDDTSGMMNPIGGRTRSGRRKSIAGLLSMSLSNADVSIKDPDVNGGASPTVAIAPPLPAVRPTSPIVGDDMAASPPSPTFPNEEGVGQRLAAVGGSREGREGREGRDGKKLVAAPGRMLKGIASSTSRTLGGIVEKGRNVGKGMMRLTNLGGEGPTGVGAGPGGGGGGANGVGVMNVVANGGEKRGLRKRTGTRGLMGKGSGAGSDTETGRRKASGKGKEGESSGALVVEEDGAGIWMDGGSPVKGGSARSRAMNSVGSGRRAKSLDLSEHFSRTASEGEFRPGAAVFDGDRMRASEDESADEGRRRLAKKTQLGSMPDLGLALGVDGLRGGMFSASAPGRKGSLGNVEEAGLPPFAPPRKPGPGLGPPMSLNTGSGGSGGSGFGAGGGLAGYQVRLNSSSPEDSKSPSSPLRVHTEYESEEKVAGAESPEDGHLTEEGYGEEVESDGEATVGDLLLELEAIRAMGDGEVSSLACPAGLRVVRMLERLAAAAEGIAVGSGAGAGMTLGELDSRAAGLKARVEAAIEKREAVAAAFEKGLRDVSQSQRKVVALLEQLGEKTQKARYGVGVVDGRVKEAEEGANAFMRRLALAEGKVKTLVGEVGGPARRTQLEDRASHYPLNIPAMPLTDVGYSLLITLAVDFGIQFIFFLISAALQTEILYDLSGAITYAACILVGLLYRTRQDGDPGVPNDNGGGLAARQVVVSVLVLVWCTRLGIFLFMRVLRTPDKRFEDLKKEFVKFAVPWSLQVVWIFLTAFAVFVVIGNPSSTQRPLQWSDYIGIVIWAFGFVLETTADTQKNIFKKSHPRDFITTGVWRYSRYANYFGEVTLWIGMFVLCAAGFVEGWQWVTIISPVFVFCLIYFVSGVAMLERSAENRYGGRTGNFRIRGVVMA
ncbi:hypothetical protein HK101_008465, partial [Irineochytrium annulatum]